MKVFFNKKIKLKVNDNEFKIIIQSLNKLRNCLIEQQLATDCVVELLIKVIK